MAALPSPTQVSGTHTAIYEAYYQLVDPNHQGSISAPTAAKFLKKSGLSDIILSKIWDLSDPTSKGCLSKDGFFVALKLCALAQSGNAVNMANINSETPPPKMGDIPTIRPPKPGMPPRGPPGTDWSVQPTEKAKYDKLFDSLEPVNGLLPGNKVRNVMVNSKLPMPTLGKIWDLADMDKDGMLDRHEFTVAMHLVYKALEKHAIPTSLPPELLRPGTAPPGGMPPNAVAPPSIPAIHPIKPPAIPPMPQVGAVIPQIPMGAPPKPPAPVNTYTAVNTVHWVVSPEDRNRYEARFRIADKDKDGFVSGVEIKDIFLQSGIPQKILAHIWGLCDTHQTGKLNLEQFALAMWLVEQTLKGVQPPMVLAPDMVPPSMRPKTSVSDSAPEPEEPEATPYPDNPELNMISKEINELAKEKRTMETEIAQKEADIKIKSGEIKSLQSELDTLAATLKQLENQKGEAQKRLNDLKGQKSTLDKEVSEIKLLLEEEQSKVALLRSQADEQERSLKEQETELNSRKQELENLKQEEMRLENSLKQSRTNFDSLNTNLQDTQLLISQAKAKITQLEETQRQMKDNMVQYESAISSNNAYAVPDSALAPPSTEFRDPEFVRFAMVNGGSPTVEKKEAVPDPFSGTNGHVNGGGFDNNDEFSGGQFKGGQSDPFNNDDPFASSNFPPTQASGFSSDPFASFGSSGAFDPFGENQGGGTSKTPVDMAGKDPFGCDPFAAPSPSPTPSPGPPLPPMPSSVAGGRDSPTPALPPKKSKQPPPRPAPPKNMLRAAPQPPLPPSPSPEPTTGATNDPFGGGGQADPFSNSSSDPFASGGFANFADFDNKFASVVNNNLSSGGSVSSGISSRPSSTTSQQQPTSSSSRFQLQPGSNNSSANPSPAFVSQTNKNKQPSGKYAGLEFTEDPFRDYRYEDPFDIEDPFENEPPLPQLPKSVQAKVADEARQVAWAAVESVRAEEERKQRLKRQEEADLEYALALSRAETTAGGK